MKGVPWQTDAKAMGDQVYYDTTVHDAQLLYLVSRHFPVRASSVPPAVLEIISASATGRGASSLSAAYTLLALDAFS